jgi:hypothetical protein
MTHEPITEFGFYADVPEEEYHADKLPTFGPTLSASGAKLLLADPILFVEARANGSKSSKSMDIGSAAHLIILGKGGAIEVVDAPAWTTNAAKDARAKAEARGVPVLNATEWAKAEAMAKAVRDVPKAAELFTGGDAEVSFYWRDKATGVPMRGRADYLTPTRIVDLKTTADPGPEAFAKSCANYGYREAAANYVEGCAALDGIVRDFTIVAVESKPPHRVRLYKFGAGDLEYGANRMAEARALFAEYERLGYPTREDLEITELVMPAWALGPPTGGTVENIEDLSPEERF